MKTSQLLLLLLCSLVGSSSAFSPRTFLTSNRCNVKPQSSSRLNLVDIQEAWTAYNVALETDPLLVKSVTAGVILGAADLAGQALEAKQKGDDAASEIDIARTVRFAFFGLVLQAPWNHFYYQMLDGAIPPTPEPFTPTTGVKVVIDQFVQAPIFTVLIFTFLGFLEGKSMESIKKQLDEDYADTMVANCKCYSNRASGSGWGDALALCILDAMLTFSPVVALLVPGKLWVPATAINLAFVPPILRVLYLNCVFFFWSIFLSLKLNKSEEDSESS
jgi:peroxisomal membrane protein 2